MNKIMKRGKIDITSSDTHGQYLPTFKHMQSKASSPASSMANLCLDRTNIAGMVLFSSSFWALPRLNLVAISIDNFFHGLPTRARIRDSM